MLRWATVLGQTAAEKWGTGCCAHFRGELGSHRTQCHLGRGLRPYQVVSWCIQPFGHNTHGPKSGRGCCVPFRGELGLRLRQCMWPGLRPTSAVQSGILIHLAMATIDISRIVGEGCCAPFSGWGCSPVGELGPRLKQCGVGRGVPPYQVVC